MTPFEAPEVQSLIHKLQGISISQEESELSQRSVTSQYIPSQPLTREKSENIGIPPVELPLPSQKRARKTPSEFDSEILSSSSIPLQVHTPPSQLQIIVQTGTRASTSSTQSLSTASSPSSTNSSIMALNQPQPRPWTN